MVIGAHDAMIIIKNGENAIYGTTLVTTSLLTFYCFPADIKVFHEPNFEILGAPIGDAIFCAKFLAQKRAKAVKLLSQMSEVGSLDPQIALLLLTSLCHLL